MYNIIERYMAKITKDDVNNFAQSKNPSVFDIDRYKHMYSETNFKKVKQVYQEYFQKFAPFLK